MSRFTQPPDDATRVRVLAALIRREMALWGRVIDVSNSEPLDATNRIGDLWRAMHYLEGRMTPGDRRRAEMLVEGGER